MKHNDGDIMNLSDSAFDQWNKTVEYYDRNAFAKNHNQSS